MVRVAFLVEKIITLAGFFKLFFTMFPCDIFIFFTNMVILLANFSSIFSLNPFVLHLITEYFIMKVLSA
ncbi:hypothetical protein COM23_08990 [Bacillus wiedmannii]|nr:hypothetical protein COM23_08990 [Bacillus wiedmannii]